MRYKFSTIIMVRELYRVTKVKRHGWFAESLRGAFVQKTDDAEDRLSTRIRNSPLRSRI